MLVDPWHHAAAAVKLNKTGEDMKQRSIIYTCVVAAAVVTSNTAAAAPLRIDGGAVDARQREGLSLLESFSREDVVVDVGFDGDNAARVIAHVTLDDLGVAAGDPVEAAFAFLDTFRPLYGFDTRSLWVRRVVEDIGYGGVAVVLSQHANGVEIVGGGVVVYVGPDAVYGSSGRALVDVPVFAGAVSAKDAEAIAIKAVGGRGVARAAAQPVVLAPSLLWSRAQREAHGVGEQPLPAWRIAVEALPGDDRIEATDVVVSARDGRVLQRIDGRRPFDLRVRGGGHVGWFCSSTGVDWFDENGTYGGVAISGNGYVARDAATRFYRHQLSHGFGGPDPQLDLQVDSTSTSTSYWSRDCQQAIFSPDMMADDVVTHELFHGVTHELVDFVYADDSGALDEHYADVEAVFTDGFDPDIGEDSRLGAVRNIVDPSRSVPPQGMSGLALLPGSGIAEIFHNAGPLNYAAALMLYGGSGGRGVYVDAMDRADVHTFFFHQLRVALPNQTFNDHVNAAISHAASLERIRPNFKGVNACNVRNAYAAAQLTVPDVDCDGRPSHSYDEDGDRIGHVEDNCSGVWNAGQRDSDGDGEGDACDGDIDGDGRVNDADNCPLDVNPGQEDRFGGSAGDVCDDADRDGLGDNDDNCPKQRNVDQGDADGDGAGDLCDDDIDDDGVGNDDDNCGFVVNADQADADGDRLGDACDNCPDVVGGGRDNDGDGRGDDCDDDRDGDGVDNDGDNCPDVENGVQLDSDHDGRGDACDDKLTGRREPIEVLLRGRDAYFERFRTTMDPCFGGNCEGFGVVHGGLQVVAGADLYARVVDVNGKVLAVAGPGRELTLRYHQEIGSELGLDAPLRAPTLELWSEKPVGEVPVLLAPWPR